MVDKIHLGNGAYLFSHYDEETGFVSSEVFQLSKVYMAVVVAIRTQ